MSSISHSQNPESELTYGHKQKARELQGVDPNSAVETEKDPVAIREWLVLFLLLLIPIINIAIVIYFAFFNTKSLSIRNFFRAYLILISVLIAVGAISTLVFDFT